MSIINRLQKILLAAFVSLSLTISHFGTIAVIGANTAEITYWNADSSKIILDINSDIPIDDFIEYITVKKDGVTITDFTAEKRIPTTTATLAEADRAEQDAEYLLPLDPVMDCTYEIYPKGGLNFDALYSVSFNPPNGTKWKKFFRVQKLWKETFDDYTITLTETEDDFVIEYNHPWVYTAAESALVPDSNGGKALALYGDGPNAFLSPAFSSSRMDGTGTLQSKDTQQKREINFADTGVPSGEYWATNSNARKQNNYSLELDVLMNENNYYYPKKITVAMTNGGHCQAKYGGSGLMASVGQYSENGNYYGYIGAAAINTARQYKSSTVYGRQANDAKIKYLFYAATSGGYNYTDAAFVASSNVYGISGITNRVTLSARDSNIKYSIKSNNKSGFINYNYTDNTTSHNWGLPLFVFDFAYANNQAKPYIIDNIVATKVIEEDARLEWGKAEITSMGQAVEGLAGLSSFDASVEVTNIGDEFPCNAVLAVFDSSLGKITNIAASPIKAVKEGTTNFDFKNIDTKGGNTFKIFFWGNNLKPYYYTP